MDLANKIREIVERHLPDPQYFVTDIEAKKGSGSTKITIYLDGDKGVDIGVCATLNKNVGRQLEEMGLLEGPYTLEVSSPGLDQPLKLPRQYHKNLGKNLRIALKEQQIEGLLQEVTADHIMIKQELKKGGDSQELKIPFSEIVKTHVLVSF